MWEYFLVEEAWGWWSFLHLMVHSGKVQNDILRPVPDEVEFPILGFKPVPEARVDHHVGGLVPLPLGVSDWIKIEPKHNAMRIDFCAILVLV